MLGEWWWCELRRARVQTKSARGDGGALSRKRAAAHWMRVGFGAPRIRKLSRHSLLDRGFESAPDLLHSSLVESHSTRSSDDFRVSGPAAFHLVSSRPRRTTTPGGTAASPASRHRRQSLKTTRLRLCFLCRGTYHARPCSAVPPPAANEPRMPRPLPHVPCRRLAVAATRYR